MSENYKFKLTVRFDIDNENYMLAIVPTVVYTPKAYRYCLDNDGVIDIWWLHFHICIGKWVRR